jgi:hypothetical protein
MAFQFSALAACSSNPAAIMLFATPLGQAVIMAIFIIVDLLIGLFKSVL